MNILTRMTKKERQRFLGNILDDSDRLKHLVSRLLELAQADSFSPSAEKSDLLETPQRVGPQRAKRSILA